LRFYHEVVEPLAKEKSTFTVKDLTDAWNAKFPDRKSSDTIRNYIDFLCVIEYMSKVPDPADKRQNLLEVIEQKSGNYTQNELSVFFTLESFKAWLNEARTITEETQILLRENLLADHEATPEAMFSMYYSDKNQNSSVNDLSLSEGAAAESSQKKSDSEKTVQYLNLSVGEMLEALRNQLPPGKEFLEEQFVDAAMKLSWTQERARSLFESLKGNAVFGLPDGSGWMWA
jgi:hypothetical protein